MSPGEPKVETSSNLDLLKDIELPVMLRFGSTRMPLEDLIRLNTGSVIELEGSLNDPIELMVNGRVIARGEAVIVQNSYGIRISEIAVPQDGIFRAAAAIADAGPHDIDQEENDREENAGGEN
jgi:flagellar motor switch protein FliN